METANREKTKFEYEKNSNCWIAYFDILGFKNETQMNKGHLSVLAYMYEEITDRINNLPNIGSPHYECSWFSDSFLFYSFNDSIESYRTIYFAAKEFFDYMIITKKWLLRGAITVGDFYVDRNSNIYLGDALVDAHNFTEKQDWIGLVLTPSAYTTLVSKGFNPFTWVDGIGFREYNVPIKRKISNSDSVQIILDFEKLWAYHYRIGDIHRNLIMDSMRFACNRKDGLEKETLRKYENTLRFYETPCQCSVCRKR
jgi:hypothetical protein